jgi:predicted nucleic acid-binding protein
LVKVFVDTAAWIALANADDELHLRANHVMRDLLTQKTRLVTTEFVLLEVADALIVPNLRTTTIRFIDGLRKMPILRIVPLSEDLLVNGWILYSQRLDKDWGLTDCTSFVVMLSEQITQAFTSDRHFEQAGFTKLL